jgi:dinuclear metal center YbgI/SA1388 family protein
MKKERIFRIQDLVGLIHRLYPPALAEEWDSVGLHVGDPAAEVSRVLVCLDPTEAVLEEAEKRGAQAVVSHHPLIFRPMKNLVPAGETGRTVFRAVRAGIAVICAHTNLDRARDGLNDWLAARLGLDEVQPLESPGERSLLKLVVFVPVGYENRVSEALFSAGAGHIGNYDQCSFRTCGSGTFRGASGSDPFLGTAGVREAASEIRLETIVPRELLGKVLPRMIKAHPYEEVAYDLIPLANSRPGIGLGRIGPLVQETSAAVYAGRVKEALGTSALRMVGEAEATVKKVAVCGGSGASLIREAARQGADLFVTGDVKYHEAQMAEELGLVLVDAGHFATEHIAVKGLVSSLNREAGERDINISFEEATGEADPFKVV